MAESIKIQMQRFRECIIVGSWTHQRLYYATIKVLIFLNVRESIFHQKKYESVAYCLISKIQKLKGKTHHE